MNYDMDRIAAIINTRLTNLGIEKGVYDFHTIESIAADITMGMVSDGIILDASLIYFEQITPASFEAEYIIKTVEDGKEYFCDVYWLLKV